MRKLLYLLLTLPTIAFSGELYTPKPKVLVGQFGENYDSAKVDIYKKLDTLQEIGGKNFIKTALQWENVERPKVVKFMDTQMYCPMPPRPKTQTFELIETSDNALGGIAKRRQYKIISKDNLGEHTFTLLVYVPKNAKGKTPVFLNENYTGNHSVIDDNKIIMPTCYLKNNGKAKITDNKAHEYQRGKGAERYPIKEIIERGYAFATFCYCEIYPDMYAEKQNGESESFYKIFDAQTYPHPRRALIGWAWGNLRALDCIEQIPELDSSRVAVVGHSRTGKAAILAGVYDKRFAMVVSNSSCILGTSMNRRNYGGTLKIATENSVYWYSPELKKYGDRIEDMPIDQQHIIAAIAPRLVYVASSTDDLWCDPVGEFLTLLEASKIYKLYGAKKLPTKDDMRVETPFIGDVGYHIRKGDHNILLYDWQRFMDFADYHNWNRR